MRKMLSLILSILLVLSGVGQQLFASEVETETEPQITLSDFHDLNDPKLLEYVEDSLYEDISKQLDGQDFYVENVSATYISKEFLEQLSYNSQSNIFFGYTLDELDKEFQGEKYVFTLGDNGETIVTTFEDYDDTYERVIKNVLIGSGVIIICVTISVATGGAGAPAASMIFATSAKTGAAFAASSGALSGVAAGIATGIQTKDMEQAIKAGALAGSESFKWGAITGAIAGGATSLVTLRAASSGGLTMNEAAIVIKESKVPAEFVKQIHTIEEYNKIKTQCEEWGWTVKEFADFCLKTKYPLEMVELFKSAEEGAIYSQQASLFAEQVGEKTALIRTIDLSYESTMADGRVLTNLERMKEGYAAIDPLTGTPYELHHIGQSIDSPLAILTKAEHTGAANNSILHDVHIANGKGVHSLLSAKDWAKQKAKFWKDMYELLIAS